MRKVNKSNTKGAKTIAEFGIEGINIECKHCVYYKKSLCKGQFNQLVPCIFAKSENDNPNKWREQ